MAMVPVEKLLVVPLSGTAAVEPTSSVLPIFEIAYEAPEAIEETSGDSARRKTNFIYGGVAAENITLHRFSHVNITRFRYIDTKKETGFSFQNPSSRMPPAAEILTAPFPFNRNKIR